MAQKASVSAVEVEIEEKVDLAPLSSLINATLFLRVPSPLSVFTDERLLALCEAHSIFSQCGLAENVTCRECEEPHTAAVVLDRGRLCCAKCRMRAASNAETARSSPSRF